MNKMNAFIAYMGTKHRPYKDIQPQSFGTHWKALVPWFRNYCL